MTGLATGNGFPNVVVTGMAMTTALATDAETTWQRLLDGNSGIRTAAEILNFMSSNHEEGVIESVRQYDAELAQKIIDQMFVFENLLDLEDRAIQLLLKEVESEALIISLKGAPPALRQKFLSNMSQRAAELLAEDLDARGPVRVSEVETQQRRILQIVRNLAESGQIVLGGKAEDAYV